MNKVTVQIYELNKETGKYQAYNYDNAILPFKYGTFLDEQLDYAVVTIERIRKKEIPLLTMVNVIIEVDNDVNQRILLENMLVVNDESFESPVGSGLYKHDLTIIEGTKLAEGIPVESLCFTNPSGNDHLREAAVPDLTYTYYEDEEY